MNEFDSIECLIPTDFSFLLQCFVGICVCLFFVVDNFCSKLKMYWNVSRIRRISKKI